MKFEFLSLAAAAGLTFGNLAYAGDSTALAVSDVPSDALVPASFTTPHYGDLDAFYGDLDAFYGDLDAFYGDLDAFNRYGDLDAFYGDLDAFYGDLDAFYGDLDAFWGNLFGSYGDLDAFYGDLDAFYGDLDAFYGDLDAFYGDLDAFVGNMTPFIGMLHSYYGDLDAFYGDLDAFYGDLDAFYGRLDTSYGDLDAFWGNTDTFAGNLNASYGDLDAFWGNLETFYGDLDAFYGDLDAFSGDIRGQYGDLDAFWGTLGAYDDSNAADYEALLSDLGTFYNTSMEYFSVPVALYTGKDFWQGFASDIFDKYGIDPTDASTLADLDQIERAKFFTDWYDGLFQFTGMDRVDHWMGAVNWSPRLTQDHDFNSEAVIGLLDFGVTDQTILSEDVVYSGGYDTAAGDSHGSSVISLMIAPYDGRGIMGMAPNASVATYNPFDETKSASFEDVETGIGELIAHDARIINMSLGVPATVLSEDWSSILDRFVSDATSEGTIFVKAAGNEGTVQQDDVDWANAAALERLIIVGATGVDGEIADWSNTPGEACAVVAGDCHALKNHFMVAPGEFMLVSDGEGGVTRQSGTSFAAPLVSGTAALIHGAWPWWKQHGEETVDVILQSAEDLGEEGVDDVYGWGMLDTEAALSPLDWNDLQFYYSLTEDGRLHEARNATWMRAAQLLGGNIRLEERGAYLIALEEVGDTYRDFRIPLSTQLYGKSTDYQGYDSERRFQRHLYQRFADWAATGQNQFGDTQGFTAKLNDDSSWMMSMTARSYTPGMNIRDGQLPFQTDIVMSQAETGTQFQFGFGDGATRLSNSQVFGFYSDYDVKTGGVNPILGLASGGSYASATLPVSDKLSITAAISEAEDDHTFIDPITGIRTDGTSGVADFSAQAANVSMAYQLNDQVRFNLDYTQLNERDSVLGDQGTGFLALEGGSVTDAVTFGAETSLPYGFAIASSATLGQTRSTQFEDGFLALSDDGLKSSAFALGVYKTGVFGAEDQMRLSLSQPLRVDEGAFTYTALEVINRETGELGQVSQTWALNTDHRALDFEAIYAMPILEGVGDFTAFARSGSVFSDQNFREDREVSVGARLSLRY